MRLPRLRQLISRLTPAVLAAALLLIAMQQSALAARGRPIIKNGTLMTDTGEPIRGVYSWGGESLDTFKGAGFNAVHVYGENFDQGTPGYNVAGVDGIVQQAGQAGMYVILTIGNGSNNGQYDWNWAIQFWNFYAPRYANDPWVIYELQNEPSYNTQYDTTTMQFEQTGYNTIHGLAPNNTILLFSVMLFSNGSGIAQNCRSLTGVDWTNTAVAFHGYAGAGPTQTAIGALQNAGYPCICTEYSNLGANTSMDATELQNFENDGVSWSCFLRAVDASHYYTPVGNIKWIPDYGSYPLPCASSGVVLNGTYHIQAAGWNYVRTDVGAGNQLDAVTTNPGTPENFVISDAGNGYVSIRSQANNAFVTSVKNGGTNPLVAQASSVGDWERYVIVPIGNGQYNLIAHSCAQYVTCRQDTNGVVWANQPVPYNWEAFVLTPVAPAGFTWISNEWETHYFSTPVDVAFGANGSYLYNYAIAGSFTFNNSTFGGDPAPGIAKSGYYKFFTQCASEWGSYTFSTPVEAAFGANGSFRFIEGISGTVNFTNTFFGGDPAPGTGKTGFYMPYTQCASENGSYTFSTPTDLAYGANGKYAYKKSFQGTITFNNTTFGDPIPGTAKAGYFRPSH